jgi:hypothetical protein
MCFVHVWFAVPCCSLHLCFQLRVMCVCVVVFNLLSCLCVSYVMCFYGSLVGRATGSPIIWCMYMCVLAVMCLFVLFVVQCVAACVHVLNVLCVFMTCVFKFVVCVCWFVVFVL